MTQDRAGACRRIERNEVAISGATWLLATRPEPRPDYDEITMSNAVSDTVASYLHFMCAALVKFRQTGAIVPSQRFLIAKMLAPVPETYSGRIIELGAGNGALTVRLAARCPGGAHRGL